MLCTVKLSNLMRSWNQIRFGSVRKVGKIRPNEIEFFSFFVIVIMIRFGPIELATYPNIQLDSMENWFHIFDSLRFDLICIKFDIS